MYVFLHKATVTRVMVILLHCYTYFLRSSHLLTGFLYCVAIDNEDLFIINRRCFLRSIGQIDSYGVARVDMYIV